MKTAAMIILLGSAPLVGTADWPDTPKSLELDTIRSIPAQHDGRWPPLDTVARDLVETVTGQESPGRVDPVVLLLAWTFDAKTWREAPLLSIANAELRRELSLPETKETFSFAELVNHRRLRDVSDEIMHLPEGQKLDPLQLKVQAIEEKLAGLHAVFNGNTLKMIPDADDPLGAWRAIRPERFDRQDQKPDVFGVWDQVRASFLADDKEGFSVASSRLADQLAVLPTAYHPKTELLELELRYNRLEPFRLAWQIMAVGAFLSLVSMWVGRRWFDALALLGLLAGFGVVTYGLALRWQIAGRVPASNMYESLLFLGWGTGAFAILSMLLIRGRLVPLTASAMGAVSLMLADLLPVDHFIRPIAPVLLDTVWMAIHVPVIMVSYSVLALGVLIAHVQLVTMSVAPGRHRLIARLDSLHYWYIHVGSILLLAGIVTGSMWAASSWGRYWGWDPKEVWSLVALLGYLTILHVRIDQAPVPRWAYVIGAVLAVAALVLVVPQLAPITPIKIVMLGGGLIGLGVLVLTHGPFATALKSVLAFWLIIMTYVGVNYVLGIGLHSYGFGTGAVMRHMLQVGTADLGLVVLCCGVYLVRRRSDNLVPVAA